VLAQLRQHTERGAIALRQPARALMRA
jgi:hypothetical protein